MWRLTLVLRNRRREKLLREQGVTEEERIAKAKLLGEQDYTDFENIYVSLLISFFASFDIFASLSWVVGHHIAFPYVYLKLTC